MFACMLLTTKETVARLALVGRPMRRTTWLAHVYRGYGPSPDAYRLGRSREVVPWAEYRSEPGRRDTPLWNESTVDEWAATRSQSYRRGTR